MFMTDANQPLISQEYCLVAVVAGEPALPDTELQFAHGIFSVTMIFEGGASAATIIGTNNNQRRKKDKRFLRKIRRWPCDEEMPIRKNDKK
jgi:hypothetical protein